VSQPYTDPVALAQGVLQTFIAANPNRKPYCCSDCGRTIPGEWYGKDAWLVNAALVDGKLLCPSSYAKYEAGRKLRERLARA
jgi:hypothetical protein